VFKQQLLGRLGLFFSISVLVGACAGGEIGDAPGGARLGPGDDFVGQIDPSEPVVSQTPAALTCAGAGPDVSTSNEWRSSEASLPAFDALYFEFKARPTAANIDGLVGVGAEDINDFAGATLTVRFAQDGLVDVRDGAVYSSDTSFAYHPGVWYTVAISADIATETYDVAIAPCGEPRETLIEGASFRQESDLSDQLSTWGVWSSKAAELEVSTPTWMASGGCAPATCESLGSECGEPSDGCNGTLNCGVCGGGQTCSSGVCVDAPVGAPPPAPAPLPPACTPATCQSLGNQCGAASDGCGGTLSCGGCGSGEFCSSGTCVADFAPPLAGAPSDGDYDHVIVLNSNQTSSSVVSQINSQGAGTVLVRSDGARRTISGGIKVPRADVTFYDLNLDGAWEFNEGTHLWSVNASPFSFKAWGSTNNAHNWIVQDSYIDGGFGCCGHFQNHLLSGTSNWRIENNTFTGYHPAGGGEHTEALWIGNAKNGIIRNNQFINNGNTAHIFFTWNGDNVPANHPNNICVEGNTFTQVLNCCYDIQTRAELSSSLNISVDPAQVPQKAFQMPSNWRRTCQ